MATKDSDNVILDHDLEEERVATCICDVEPTEEELQEGARQGEQINTEDDDDNGLDGALGLVFTKALTDRDAAMAKARALKAVMLKYEVPEVSIELMEGRPNSFGRYDALYCVDEMSHHTVSRFGVGNLTPCLHIIKAGRSDLPGPLSNGYGGYDLCYRIVTFGYANHPGVGGPLTIPAYSGGTYTIPKDSGRRYMWGTEWEGGINEADWDRPLKNPRNGKSMTMREFMGRSNAALREFHKIAHHSEHSTWTTRKIDRLHYTSKSGTDELLRYVPTRPPIKPTTEPTTPQEVNNMPDKAQFQQWVRRTPIKTGVGGDNKPTDRPLEVVLSDIEHTQEVALTATKGISDSVKELSKAVAELKKAVDALPKDTTP